MHSDRQPLAWPPRARSPAHHHEDEAISGRSDCSPAQLRFSGIPPRQGWNAGPARDCRPGSKQELTCQYQGGRAMQQGRAEPPHPACAPRMPGLGVIVPRARRSGRRYQTPVNVFSAADGYVIALTYGPDTDWVKNVVAAGGCSSAPAARPIGAHRTYGAARWDAHHRAADGPWPSAAWEEDLWAALPLTAGAIYVCGVCARRLPTTSRGMVRSARRSRSLLMASWLWTCGPDMPTRCGRADGRATRSSMSRRRPRV
jgi:hypothetical protein